MQTWLKYAISFFALALILTSFIFMFGPASTRQAFRSGETQTGQLNSNAQLTTPGEPLTTTSGTSLSAEGASPKVAPQQQNGRTLKNDRK